MRQSKCNLFLRRCPALFAHTTKNTLSPTKTLPLVGPKRECVCVCVECVREKTESLMDHHFHPLPQPNNNNNNSLHLHPTTDNNSLAHHFALGLFPPASHASNNNNSTATAPEALLEVPHDVMDHQFDPHPPQQHQQHPQQSVPQLQQQHSPFSSYGIGNNNNNGGNGGGSLSRPASLTSMSQFALPANTLSRVGSFHNAFPGAFSFPAQTPSYPFPSYPTSTSSTSTSNSNNNGNNQQTPQNNGNQLLTSPNWQNEYHFIKSENQQQQPPYPLFQSTATACVTPPPHHLQQQQQQFQSKQTSKKPAAAAAAAAMSKPTPVKKQNMRPMQQQQDQMGNKAMRISSSNDQFHAPLHTHHHHHHHHIAEMVIPGPPPPSSDNDMFTGGPNQKPRSRNPSSMFRGVSKCSKDGRWQARIRVKRQVTYLGRFVKEEDAARRYDEAAREHHGDKAVLNFLTEDDINVGRRQAMGNGGQESGSPTMVGATITPPLDQDLPPIE